MKKYILMLLAGILIFSFALLNFLRINNINPTPIISAQVTPSNLSYVGAFKVPPNGSTDATSFAYGGTALGFNAANNSLFIVGHAQQQRMAEISIPTPIASNSIDNLNTATLLQPFTDVTDGKIGQVDPGQGNQRIGGSYVHNGKLVVTAYSFYDGDANAVKSHFTSGLNMASSTAAGPFKVGTVAPAIVAGYMISVPQSLQSSLGGPVLTGQCCLSIITRTSFAPSVASFDPDNLGVQDPVPMVELMDFPDSHQTINFDAEWSLANFSNAVTRAPAGGFIDEANRRLYIAITQGMDPICYKGQPPIPGCTDNGGYNAGIFKAGLLEFSIDDLIKVKNGQMNPWDMRPLAWHELDLTARISNNADIGGLAFDPATGRVFISQLGVVTANFDYSPVIHVYQLGGSLPSDITSPSISITSPASGATVSGSVTVAANASDDVGVIGVQFKLDGVNLGTEDTSSPYAVSWDTTTVSSGSHTITATARDAAGNTSNSSSVTVTILGVMSPTDALGSAVEDVVDSSPITVTAPDTVSPTISEISASSISASSATITWVTNESSDSQVEYGTTVSYGTSTTLNSSMITNHSQNLSGLASSTTYHYRVKSKDATGNLTTSGDSTFSTASLADTSAPTISITAPANNATVSGSSVAISATAFDAIGVVGVQFKVDGVNINSEDTSSPYSITWNTGTASNGSHLLTATARDAAGNATTSSAISVVVANVVTDAVIPSTPTNLSATATSPSQINLSWGSSTDNAGVAGYRIFRNGAQVATSTVNSYLDSGLTQNTSYSYTVAAYDSAGNISNESASVSAKTLASTANITDNAPQTYTYGSTDIYPPVTTINGNGYDFGVSAYFHFPVTYDNVKVSLSCSDGQPASSASGCNITLYCVDSANTCAPSVIYTGDIIVSVLGTSYIRYYSTDKANNKENLKSKIIIIENKSAAQPISSPQDSSVATVVPITAGRAENNIKRLQIFLNTNGFKLAETGAGSPGNETTILGPRTREALKKFQYANGLSRANRFAGNFGPWTKAIIKEKYGVDLY